MRIMTNTARHRRWQTELLDIVIHELIYLVNFILDSFPVNLVYLIIQLLQLLQNHVIDILSLFGYRLFVRHLPL